ncbi:hypothetical protein [Actomonas aquatica]|uniref:TonB C-terminal domain-containing protein n=1 Tax=Actomonas aquatica TaxID=2866162 RepID=A0ABZ1CE83_9BACT|nr:hypothetical protein [Opitutus sp. WL0086]WRQ89602.1 hypothetical protein K1X11_009290 [Opitutus sp. WL0086]
MRQTSGLRLKPTTKVSATDVTVADLKVERCFSPAADPTREQMRNQVALQDFAADRAAEAEMDLRRDATPADPNSVSADAPSAEQQMLISTDIFSAFVEAQQFQSDMWSVAASNGGLPGPARKAPEFDAVRLKFEVSSATPLKDVQGVVVVRFSKEGELSDISFTHKLGDIGPKPREIEIMRRGIPPGYEVKDSRLHLFLRAEELPTNLSEKRYAVTDEEAREYVRLAHLGEHRGETVSAAPAWSLIPRALLERENGADLDFPVQVDLDEKGRLIRLHDELAVIPPMVRDVVEEMVFVPALRDGEAVASTITVNPAEFFQ